MDEILDRSLREAVGVAEQLEQAGVFSCVRPQTRVKQVLAAKLAVELYMTRIGQASHLTFDEALSAAIAATNRHLAEATANTDRRSQQRLVAGAAFAALGQSAAAIVIQPAYELDRTKASQMGAL